MTCDFASVYASVTRGRDALGLCGGMPELATSRISANVYYRNYLQGYLERDVRQIANIRNNSAFNRFPVLLAGKDGTAACNFIDFT